MKPQAAFFIALLTSTGVNALPQYELIDLGTLGENFSYAHALNSHGQTTGSFGDLDQSRQFNPTSAFVGDKTGIRSIEEVASAYDSSGIDINDQGVVLGTAIENQGDPTLSFLYSSGHFEYLPQTIGATSLNNKGQLTGRLGEVTQPGMAFIRTGDEVLELSGAGAIDSTGNAINDHGQIAATVYDGTTRRAAYGDANGLVALPGLSTEGFSEALDINDSGFMTGYIYSGGVYTSYLATREELVVPDIGRLGNDIRGVALNDHNHIVGSDYQGGDSVATLWTPEDGLVRLSDLVNDISGWYGLALAEDINNAGQIVGLGIREDYELHAFLLDPLPEASVSETSQSLLLLTGLGLLMLRRSVGSRRCAAA